jgi:hypothetical protein
MTMMKSLAILCLFLLDASVVQGASKIKRVQSGQVYNDHDAVHIVVNKVG